MTLDNAIAHLYHFCTSVHNDRYSDPRPTFSIQRVKAGSIKAKVSLSTSIHPSVRYAFSKDEWQSLRMARKDAAFEACLQLHSYGLLNDNLLPLLDKVNNNPDTTCASIMSALIPVYQTIDSWGQLREAHLSHCGYTWNSAILSVDAFGMEYIKVIVILPIQVAPLQSIRLYWNESITFTVNMTPLGISYISQSALDLAKNTTAAILGSLYEPRISGDDDDYLTYLYPVSSTDIKELNSSTRSATEIYKTMGGGKKFFLQRCFGIVHERCRFGTRRVFQGFHVSQNTGSFKNEAICEYSNNTTVFIRTKRFPKKRNFLDPVTVDESNKPLEDKFINVNHCVTETIPLPYTVLASLIPSIYYCLGGRMLAQQLHNELLSQLGFRSLSLILAATTASSASAYLNYQRLEFFGDCILKYCTSLQIMAQNPSWPESYLTDAKAKVVSNDNLAKVSLRLKLSRYTITKGLKGVKWRPPRIKNTAMNSSTYDDQTLQSSKVQADVVEAIIGATFVECGLPKVVDLLGLLFSEETWLKHEDAHKWIYEEVPDKVILNNQERVLEKMIGYRFRKGLLLREAITHASLASSEELTSLSYERLEFLGDAVLDQIVSDIIFTHKLPKAHNLMHSIRTAVVSTAFLSFICIEYSPNEFYNETCRSTHEDDVDKAGVQYTTSHIWQCMRHASSAISSAQQETIKRHKDIRLEILDCLKQGKFYPWHLLSHIRASKFFADIIESILGAIYIDSKGSLVKCLEFLEKIGVTKYLRQILKSNVDCLHPKEKLGILACSKKVKYDVEKKGEVYRCQIYLDNKKLGELKESSTKADAEVQAAWNIIEQWNL